MFRFKEIKKSGKARRMKRALSLLLALLLSVSPVLTKPAYTAEVSTAADPSDDVNAYCADLWKTVQELGEDVINRVLETLGESCTVEQAPKTLGRILGALIGPPRKKK